MKLRFVGLAAAGLLAISSIAYAAGLFPDYPVVGGASYCAGSSQSAVGSIIGSVTGCPNTVPAGPSIVTGNEQVPADTRLANGVQPQTVLIPMASFNALPITFQTVTSPAPLVSAANTSGGIYFLSAATITTANITLPQAPIDGQQYVISADRAITGLTVSAGALTLANNSSPLSLTNSLTSAQASNFRFIFNQALNTWARM